jgi:ABC-type hemin transport system ATPase subunit
MERCDEHCEFPPAGRDWVHVPDTCSPPPSKCRRERCLSVRISQNTKSTSQRVGTASVKSRYGQVRFISAGSTLVRHASSCCSSANFRHTTSTLALDEPFSALDIGWRLALYEHWSTERADGKATSVLVTHDVAEAFLLASHAMIMSACGKIIAAINSSEPKPRNFDLDSTREYFLRMAPVIEQTPVPNWPRSS